MEVVQYSLQYACIIAYALLVYRECKTQSVYLVPWFTTLCVLMAINGVLFQRFNNYRWFLIEPLILSLQACAVIEAFLLLPPRIPKKEAQGIAMLLLGVGLVAGIRASELVYGTDEMAIHKHWWLIVHVVLSITLLFGVLVLWLKPVRFTRTEKWHVGLLTIYMFKFPVIELIRGTETAVDVQYELLSAGSKVWTLLCLIAWARYGLLATRPHPAVHGNAC